MRPSSLVGRWSSNQPLFHYYILKYNGKIDGDFSFELIAIEPRPHGPCHWHADWSVTEVNDFELIEPSNRELQRAVKAAFEAHL